MWNYPHGRRQSEGVCYTNPTNVWSGHSDFISPSFLVNFYYHVKVSKYCRFQKHLVILGKASSLFPPFSVKLQGFQKYSICSTFSPTSSHQHHLHPEETMLTMMEVEVLELWTRTVTRIPTTRPATGLERIALSLKMSPATLPGKEARPRELGLCTESLWDLHESKLAHRASSRPIVLVAHRIST